ncbi:MAG TPA: acyl-CoA dehydrogenase [Caldithrix abyssi]|uniref:Acyl-CoA dehydrogenase n=1 Tax=Caldithrix abyssi TaxID=187145 RepID=A0A7V4TY12_CALAY|nr:acyl-CoA dehydrogenase [Caldithrix abyssi]
MPNFFTDNKDLVFQFEHLDLEEIVELTENGYAEAEKYDYAPHDYQDAMDNYRKVLEIAGDIAGNIIAPNAASVDEEGAHFENGKVRYAKGTQEALDMLSKAELMGITLPRRYGGLNFPTTIYIMAIEMISRADASLMNIFGLQDIAETINKFADEEQKKEYLPQFAEGKVTGAMALTEPDAGSDLQAVKLQAYQTEDGQWRLRGVKRFITNGNGDILLVLARSEPGTKDGRGLSMFVCYGDDTVKVRRIENKLGIHGSPTCELQFNDTPAQLVGKRKFGLIKYVMDLMNGARLGVSAQALGISQAAYEEALDYAKAREQFGKSIYDIPVVANMLIDMRVRLESDRSLLYATAKAVDLRDKLEERIHHLKAEGKDVSELTARQKEASKIAALLTPMTKYVLTENANKITYDALQIHGGTGYMKEFNIERLARDARITNIYEGTSQLQVVAAIGGVINDIMGAYFEQKEKRHYKGNLQRLADMLKEIRLIFLDSLKYVEDKNDKYFQDVAAKELVELYSYLFTGYLLLDEAEVDSRKVFIANRFIISAEAKARQNAEAIKNEQFSDLLHADEILI